MQIYAHHTAAGHTMEKVYKKINLVFPCMLTFFRLKRSWPPTARKPTSRGVELCHLVTSSSIVPSLTLYFIVELCRAFERKSIELCYYTLDKDIHGSPKKANDQCVVAEFEI